MRLEARWRCDMPHMEDDMVINPAQSVASVCADGWLEVRVERRRNGTNEVGVLHFCSWECWAAWVADGDKSLAG